MGQGVVRVKFYGSFSFCFALLPLPPGNVNSRYRQMGFGQIVVETQSPASGSFGLRHIHFRVGGTLTRENIVFERKLRIGESIIRVGGDGLFVIIDRLFNVVRAWFAESIAAFEQ